MDDQKMMMAGSEIDQTSRSILEEMNFRVVGPFPLDGSLRSEFFRWRPDYIITHIHNAPQLKKIFGVIPKPVLYFTAENILPDNFIRKNNSESIALTIPFQPPILQYALAYAKDLHQMQKQIDEYSFQTSIVFDEISEGAMVTDSSGIVESVNYFSEKLSMKPKNELIGKGIAEAVSAINLELGVRVVSMMMRFRDPRSPSTLFESVVSPQQDGTIFTYEAKAIRISREGLHSPRILFLVRLSEHQNDTELRMHRYMSLLESIQKAQSQYITLHDHKLVFNELLKALVSLTDSEYGFLDEVRIDTDGQSYKKSLALSNIAWDAESQKLYETLINSNLEFRNIKNLAGAPVNYKQIIISNDVPTDHRRGGLPAGHPDLKTYMGIPMYYGGEVIGVAGVANKKGGYTVEMASFLDPFLSTCASIIHSVRAAEDGKLRLSEEKFAKVFQISPDSINLNRLSDGVYIDINEGFTRLTGFTREDTIGRSSLPGGIGIWVNTDDRVRLVDDLLKNGEVSGLEAPFRIKSGETITGLVSAKILDVNGEKCILSVTRDISERKRMEEELRIMLKKYKILFEMSPAGITVSDQDGKIIESNIYAEELLGLRKEEHARRRIDGQEWTIIRLDGTQMPASEFASVRALQEQKLLQNVEMGIVKNPGAVVWLSVSAAPIPIDGYGVAIIYYDITERIKMENALRESEELFRTIFETATDAIFVKDKSLRYIRLNDAAARLLKLKRDEIIGFTDDVIFGEELGKKIQEADRQVLNGKSLSSENIYTISSYSFTAHVVKVPLRDKDRNIIGLCGIARDISEKKQAEHAFLQSQKMESIGVLAGGVAHDFNNILNAILGQNTLARKKIPADSPAVTHIDKALAAVERAADLTKQLLAYSGQGKISVRQFDLNETIRKNLHLFELSIPKIINLSCSLHAAPLVIQGDETQIHQVIMNLIINSGESIGEKNGSIKVITGLQFIEESEAVLSRFTQSSAASGWYVVLEIADTGCGMNGETIMKIFDPFYTTKFTGRGLGLSAVLGIIRSHKGGLDVQSNPGEGTVFKIFLPASEMSVTIEHSLIRSELKAGKYRSSVLIIEDEKVVVDLLIDIFTVTHIPFISAENGLIGIEKFRQHQKEIGLVLLDLTMPEMSGMETLRRLRELNPGIKVIVTSGYTEEVIAQRFEGLQFSGFIQKPYNPVTLVELVGNYLR